MRLAQQCQGTNALHDVVLPAVGGEFVMDGEGGDARKPGSVFFESFKGVGLEIEAVREIGSQVGIGADGEEAVGAMKSEIRNILHSSFFIQLLTICYLRYSILHFLIAILYPRSSSLAAQQAAEIMVALLVLDVQAKRVPITVQFNPDNRFDAGLGGGLREFDGPVEIVFVGQSDRRQIVALGKINNRPHRKS